MSLPSSVLRVSAGSGSPTLSTPGDLALGFFSPSASVSALRFVAAGLAAGLGAAAAAAAGLPALRALRRGASLILTETMDGWRMQAKVRTPSIHDSSSFPSTKTLLLRKLVRATNPGSFSISPFAFSYSTRLGRGNITACELGIMLIASASAFSIQNDSYDAVPLALLMRLRTRPRFPPEAGCDAAPPPATSTRPAVSSVDHRLWPYESDAPPDA